MNETHVFNQNMEYPESIPPFLENIIFYYKTFDFCKIELTIDK